MFIFVVKFVKIMPRVEYHDSANKISNISFVTLTIHNNLFIRRLYKCSIIFAFPCISKDIKIMVVSRNLSL